MNAVPALESLATKQVLSQYNHLEDLPLYTRPVVANLFRFAGSYKLSSRSTYVFGYNGNLGMSNKVINYFIFKISLGFQSKLDTLFDTKIDIMDTEIEIAIAMDMDISGTTLMIEKTHQGFVVNFENSTKVINLGKTL